MTGASKIRALVATALGGAIIVGLWAWQRHIEPDRFIYAAAAVDAERAFVLMRKAYDRSEPHWVMGVVAASGRLEWSGSLVDNTIEGLAVGGDVAVLRVPNAGIIAGISLSDGEVLWEHQFSHPYEGGSANYVYADSEIVVAATGPSSLEAFATATGEHLWTREVYLDYVQITDWGIIVQKGHVLSRDTGQTIVEARLRGKHCYREGHLYFVERVTENRKSLELMTDYDLSSQERRVIRELPQDDGPFSNDWATCGWLDDMLVVTTHPEPEGPSHHARAQLLDPADGSIVREIALGGRLHLGDGWRGLSSSLGGELAPHVVTVLEEGDQLRLVSLDLARGRVDWRGPVLPDLMERDLWTGRKEDVSYIGLPLIDESRSVSSGRYHYWLLAFDGHSGELSGAVTYHPPLPFYPTLGASMMRDSVVWLAQLYVGTTRRDVAVTPLDYRTLQPHDQDSRLLWATGRARRLFVAH